MSIRVNDLYKEYGEQKAVNGISFSVNKGEIVGFLGPNGAGKSTTMKILTGYLKPSAGEAIVCGLDVGTHPLEVKKKIGYLPESNPLYFDMYVKEYLSFIARVHRIPQIKKSVSQVIEMVGLGAEQKKKTGQLSKGYKQRVGLAAALIYDPEVLILDEPTTGLDPNQIIEIREVIRQQGKDKTVLFSSHILQEVEAICSRAIIINKGVLVADDSIAALRELKGKTQHLLVEFAHEVKPEVFTPAFESAQIQVLSGSKYRFIADNPELLRRKLRDLALQFDLDIMTMQTESQSLETIFKELTGNNEE
ncbi:MAG: gliding motility-associated ABC transporter ATP-binding subunit GldA [Chitinophagaceae bacterium]|nr:gliding motility-associated ABC transporter ATP-binding subunit GldA [Chitinophagaceae bacterium]